MIDVDAIWKLYIENGDGFDASGYDVQGLCTEVRALRASIREALAQFAEMTQRTQAMVDANGKNVTTECAYLMARTINAVERTLKAALEGDLKLL